MKKLEKKIKALNKFRKFRLLAALKSKLAALKQWISKQFSRPEFLTEISSRPIQNLENDHFSPF